MPLCDVCLSVCVSVTFVSCVKTSDRILKIYSPSGSPTILVFPCQTGWQYSDGEIFMTSSLNVTPKTTEQCI